MTLPSCSHSIENHRNFSTYAIIKNEFDPHRPLDSGVCPTGAGHSAAINMAIGTTVFCKQNKMVAAKQTNE